jgi:hypothetical protein
MSSWTEITRQVEERAQQRCEYCRMHQALQGATFHVEHIVPSSQGGPSDVDNLAWACPSCNLHKSDRTSVPDPDSNQMVPLFHPRNQRWPDHFQWEGYRVQGRTVIGRATAFSLDFNHPRRLLIREAEESFGLFPPEEGAPAADNPS